MKHESEIKLFERIATIEQKQTDMGTDITEIKSSVKIISGSYQKAVVDSKLALDRSGNNRKTLVSFILATLGMFGYFFKSGKL